jgi:hypothetical protein
MPLPLKRQPHRSRTRWRSPAAILLLVGVLVAGPLAGPARAEPAVVGFIKTKYDQLGGRATFGAPVTEQAVVFDGVGLTQRFERGNISYHPAWGAYSVKGAIWARWVSMGGEFYGYPTTDESPTPDGIGRYNHFRVPDREDKSIYWTARTGAHAVFGLFRSTWSSLGWERSYLGYPTTSEFHPVDQFSFFRRQNYDGGWMLYDGATAKITRWPSVTRSERLSIIKCKFKDVPDQPYWDDYYNEFFTEAGRGMGGFADYLSDMTYGRVNTKGSEVRGWFTINRTLQASKDLPGTNASKRPLRFKDCVDAALAGGYSVPSGNRTVVVMNARIDGWGETNRTFLDKDGLYPLFAFHELLHGLGVSHSFSNVGSHGCDDDGGEYDDDWDQMSAKCVHSYDTDRWGRGPVGLNAPHRAQLGGLVSSQIRSVAPPGYSGNYNDYTIYPLEDRPVSGRYQNIRANFSGRIVSVEYRQKSGWSRGIPNSIVLIHNVDGLRTMLIRQTDAAGKPPAQSMSYLHNLGNGSVLTFGITVLEVNPAYARIRVHG